MCEGHALQVSQEYAQADRAYKQPDVIKGALESRLKAACNDRDVRDPHQTKVWESWCYETNQAQNTIDDDELQLAGGGEFKNAKCVLTQKDIFELDEPVEDSQRYIWEKSAILEYIGGQMRRNAFCGNPANARTPITEDELKPARRLIRETQRRQRAAATQGVPADNVEEILQQEPAACGISCGLHIAKCVCRYHRMQVIALQCRAQMMRPLGHSQNAHDVRPGLYLSHHFYHGMQN
eukprot:TRINITY_DN7934_c0_g1_i8.p2 TRINITY_DN7934_c0_g1~~TRINITY_DN7934_c0_g1_i8.p2  ORF type:complete len:237 (-),score=24.20 TRINITY_DN7934_c0_g1_i8:178-888(-)